MGKKMDSPSRGISFSKEMLYDLVVSKELQHWKAAEVLGVDRSTVRRWCKKWGINSQRTGPKSGAEHPNWKGGRMKINGYISLYNPNHPFASKGGRVLEHRFVMECMLGRYLLKTEVVHHKDGNKANNHPDNLELFSTNNEHRSMELLSRIGSLTIDGRERLQNVLDKIPNRDSLPLPIYRPDTKPYDDLRPLSTDHQTL